MERRELILIIRSYIENLSEEEKYCNGCTELKTNKRSGARGQQYHAFDEGICSCSEHELT